VQNEPDVNINYIVKYVPPVRYTCYTFMTRHVSFLGKHQDFGQDESVVLS